MLGRSPKHPQNWMCASSVAAKQLLFFWTTCRAITIYRQFIITKAAPVNDSRVQGGRNRTRPSSLLEKEKRAVRWLRWPGNASPFFNHFPALTVSDACPRPLHL